MLHRHSNQLKSLGGGGMGWRDRRYRIGPGAFKLWPISAKKQFTLWFQARDAFASGRTPNVDRCREAHKRDTLPQLSAGVHSVAWCSSFLLPPQARQWQQQAGSHHSEQGPIFQGHLSLHQVATSFCILPTRLIGKNMTYRPLWREFLRQWHSSLAAERTV